MTHDEHIDVPKEILDLRNAKEEAKKHVMDYVKRGSDFIKPEAYDFWQKEVHDCIMRLENASIVDIEIELMKQLKHKGVEEAILLFNALDMNTYDILIRNVLKVCAYNGEEFYAATEYNVAKPARK